MHRTHTNYLALRPRLIHDVVDGEETGFLKLSPSGDPIAIGPVDSPEYRLVESLFGPAEDENRNAGRFHVLSETTERIYEDMTHTELLEGVHVSSRMRDAIDAAISHAVDRLMRSPAGRYLAVRSAGKHLLMKILPA